MQVLLHTSMDGLRKEDDREINHHGRSIKVEPVDSAQESQSQVLTFIYVLIPLFANMSKSKLFRSDVFQKPCIGRK